jgi:acyl-CoA thioester hydrolase
MQRNIVPSQFLFEWPVRVYIEDTDMGGVVFYANYLKFFERARSEWLRTFGVNQQALAKEYSLIFVVSQVSVDFLSPARIDDELKISVNPVRIGRASVLFEQSALREETILASAKIQIVSVSLPQMRPVAIPPDVLLKMKNSVSAPL